MVRSVAVIGAPSALGIRPYDDGRVRRLDLTPRVLRERGVVARLAAADLGDVVPPARYSDLVRPPGRVRNQDDLADYARELAGRVASASRDGRFVLLLGGDCSILFGALLGLRQAGRPRVGLVYFDAHSDFATLEESQSGSAASMNLALATGRIDAPLARLDGARPLVSAEDVVHIGSRDEGEPYGNAELGRAGAVVISQRVIDAEGVADVLTQTFARVLSVDGGFWVHFDVDVLDPGAMPAVDSPIAGGLELEEAAALLGPIVRHPAALGLQVTIYDSTLDPDGAAAARLVDLLVRSLTGDGDRHDR
jgi:arginase